jgi:hypothetical protein
MFIVYECGACVLAALIAATLLCTAYMVFLVLKQGGRTLAYTWQERTRGAIQLKGRWPAAESSDS